MVMNSTTVMKVEEEEEETVMMKKKKNDDDDEEHGETNNNNSRNVLGKYNTQCPPRPVQSYRNKKNKSCTTEAIMKHMLVPIKNLCIQSLSEDVCNLVTGLGIVHPDGLET